MAREKPTPQKVVVSADQPFRWPTKREVEIIAQVAKGLSNPEIGKVLGVSKNTIGMSLERSFARFGVHNRLELVLRAIRTGQIFLGEEDKPSDQCENDTI